MGGRRGDPGGKIFGLIQQHEQYPEAFEATLIQAGLRWRDVEHPSPARRADAWTDILAVISSCAWDSPLARKQPDWQWGNPFYELTALIAEVLHSISLRTPNKTKARQQDVLRIPRPGERTKLGDALPLADMEAWLSQDFVEVKTASPKEV
ncbi:hypothetical protein ACUIAC_01055 [Dermabacteraceae bacterium P13138]|nr:hypothetical protein [Dermabacteraceae bacterium TAE3-ERU27]